MLNHLTTRKEEPGLLRRSYRSATLRTIVVSVGVGVCAGVGAVLFRVGDVYRRDVTTFRSCEKVGDVMQLYSRELARHEAERREP